MGRFVQAVRVILGRLHWPDQGKAGARVFPVPQWVTSRAGQ
jgi:hypothetical protein